MAGAETTPPPELRSRPLCLCVEDGQETVMSVADGNRLLAEEMRSLAMKKESLKEEVKGGGVYNAEEAILFVGLQHCLQVVEQWFGSVNFVEQMLQDQLVAAIGKEVTVGDFATYMRFHYRSQSQLGTYFWEDEGGFHG